MNNLLLSLVRLRTYVGSFYLALMISGMMTGHAGAQEDEIIAGGSGKYQKYCASCHGSAGKGNGDLAAMLVVKPADLTQLRRNNNGEFPFWRVYRAIDGREVIRGHGGHEMPLWGLTFRVEEGANGSAAKEDIVRGRIWQLVYYLESIQEK